MRPEHAAPAFDALVAEHGPGVVRICRGILRDSHLGDDAAQEAFLRLWRRFDDGPPDNPGGWLRRAAVSAAIDLDRRRPKPEASVLAETAVPAGPSPPGPERGAALDELRGRLDAAVALLPDSQRTVFVLRHHAGLPLAEVAEVLGLALPTVKTHLARAVLKLQAALKAFRPGDDRP